MPTESKKKYCWSQNNSGDDPRPCKGAHPYPKTGQGLHTLPWVSPALFRLYLSPGQRVCGASWMYPSGICTPHCRPSFRYLGFGIPGPNDPGPTFRAYVGLLWGQFVVVKCVDGPWVHMMQFATCVCTGLLLVQNGAGVRREVGRPQGPGANPPTLPCSGKELLIV